MPFVPAVNTAQVSIRYLYQGQRAENTVYFEMIGGVTEAKMEALAEAIGGKLIADHLPNLPNSLILSEIYVVDLTTETSPAITETGGMPAPGGLSTPALPNNVTLTVSFRTNGRGRSSRGRNYLMGLTEPLVVGNTVDAAFTGVWVPFYTYLLTLDEPDGFIWSVVSRFEDGAPRATALVQPVTGVVVVDMVVDSQRRRLPGRGT